MKSFITGVTGFVGSHLAQCLLERGDSVVGMARHARWCVGAESLADKVALEHADLIDGDRLDEILDRHQPGTIYHLAGHANVRSSVVDPSGTARSNVEGSFRLFESIVRKVPSARLVLVSSGLVYGQPPAEELPITESTTLRPTTPYAICKAAADMLARRWAAEEGLRVVIVRPFNLIGPRQESSYVVASFARQVALSELDGGQGRMRVGRLDVRRDFTDVRDAVRAFVEAAGLPSGTIVNIASGTTVPVKDVLDGFLSLTAGTIDVQSDLALFRANDPPILKVANDELRRAAGWEARIPLLTTLRDTLDYWRWRLRSERSGSVRHE